MTGSALSLYLEETKTNEDSMFPSEISPIKKEAVHESQSNLNSLTGAREKVSRGKADPVDVLSPTSLALHKVVLPETDRTGNAGNTRGLRLQKV